MFVVTRSLPPRLGHRTPPAFLAFSYLPPHRVPSTVHGDGPDGLLSYQYACAYLFLSLYVTYRSPIWPCYLGPCYHQAPHLCSWSPDHCPLAWDTAPRQRSWPFPTYHLTAYPLLSMEMAPMALSPISMHAHLLPPPHRATVYPPVPARPTKRRALPYRLLWAAM